MANRDHELDALAAIHADPVLFVTELLGATPEPWQATFLTNVAKHDRVAVRSGHGVGKTVCLAWIILWTLLTRIPVKIVVTAPTAGQLDRGLWPELSAWHRKLPAAYRELLDVMSDRAVLVGSASESFAVAVTTSRERPEALQGVHSENLVFLVDEASGVDELVFETAISALSTKGSKIVMTGNPTRSSGYFFDAFHSKANLWVTQKVSAFDSKWSKDGTLIQEFEGKKDTNPNVWRVRVLGEFPEGDDDTLIPRSLIERAIIRNNPNNHDDWVATTDHYPIIWGVDVARFGQDSSALCKRRGNAILEPIKVWKGRDTMQTAGAIKAEWDATIGYLQPTEIYIDVIGIGSGVYDRLREQGLPVVECAVSERASDPDRFLRLRDELWYRAKEWFERRNCKIPDQPTIVPELCGPTYTITSAGKIQVESKAEMKKRGYESPNMADAFCMTLMNIGEINPISDQPFENAIPDAYWV